MNVKLLAQSYTQEGPAIEDEQMRQNLVKSRISLGIYLIHTLSLWGGAGGAVDKLVSFPKENRRIEVATQLYFAVC